jgi:hypothetical protein
LANDAVAEVLDPKHIVDQNRDLDDEKAKVAGCFLSAEKIGIKQ